MSTTVTLAASLVAAVRPSICLCTPKRWEWYDRVVIYEGGMLVYYVLSPGGVGRGVADCGTFDCSWSSEPLGRREWCADMVVGGVYGADWCCS